jgi:hypothetical protein
MEGDFQSGKSINTKMNNCAISNLWASAEAMRKDLFIDLDKQEVIRLSTGKKLTPFLRGATKKRKNHYYSISFYSNKKSNILLLHRLFFYWRYGYLPKLVDHIDTDRLNNNIENLREITPSGSSRNTSKDQNRKRKPSSKHKGVSKTRSNKWQARITDLNGKATHLGTFDKEDDAGEAYNDAIRKYGLEEVSVMNDTPQERARTLSLFDEPEPILNLK